MVSQALLNSPKLLICDEPTSALDPVGRKEILDILLSVKERTTVLFSTHILADVERICTDIAFLDGGRIKLTGKLADIKGKYRSDEYIIEAENDEAIKELIEEFDSLKKADDMSGKVLTFKETDISLYKVLDFISKRKLPVIKVERLEPSLENLFLEVVG